VAADVNGNGRAQPPGGDLACREVVELVTRYVEGAMPAAERLRFEEHIARCSGCETYLAQMRQATDALGDLREDHLPEGRREQLMAAYRGWRRP